MSDNNQYTKLEQANTTFLNPTIELVKQYKRQELHQHCYYKITKYPKGDDDLWDQIQTRDFEKLETYVVKVENTKIKSNLKLAIQNKDVEYIDFLWSHRPKTKIKLILKPKTSTIPPDLLKTLNLEDHPNPLNYELKHALNQYILKNKLQRENEIKIDQTLHQLMPEALVNTYVHYLKYHQYFRDVFQKA